MHVYSVYYSTLRSKLNVILNCTLASVNLRIPRNPYAQVYQKTENQLLYVNWPLCDNSTIDCPQSLDGMDLGNLTDYLNCSKDIVIKQDYHFENATSSEKSNGTFCTSFNVQVNVFDHEDQGL
jgi:hypothetical protein